MPWAKPWSNSPPHKRNEPPRTVARPGGTPLAVVLALLAPAALTLAGCLPDFGGTGTTATTGEDTPGNHAARPAGGAEEAPPAITAWDDLPDSFLPHRDFTLTLGDLRELLAGESSRIAETILESPQEFLGLMGKALEMPRDLFVLVDKETPLPADYVPRDLVDLTKYQDRLTLNREGLSLRKILMPDLLAMVEEAAREGVILDLSSTYRSYAYQEWLFQYWVDRIGQERAERSSARPGSSQHQLGTAIDFGSVTGPFAEHPAGRWLAEKGWRYGFSLSYPQGYEDVTGYIYEPWHFRYISRPGTRLERFFFDGIQQYFLEFWDRREPFFRERYHSTSPSRW
ncbi:M15 family metallopeptidase [Alkalispirochaeta alkalica]|uniref:M15 family metallopeptidase n=1 Tax=Alkalispirochaeta alkalica TaxID=46356 RepID=UPI000365F9AE|nr:M15 family metallopeptidase [Alkalispirochaeta alkalica]